MESKKEPTIAIVHIIVPEDGNPLDEEYQVDFIHSTCPLEITKHGGVNDFDLILEAIENNFDLSCLMPYSTTIVRLKEDGEWEGNNWHRYFTIIKDSQD